MTSPTVIVAYLALFVSVGAIFLFVNLLLGRFLRPKSPNKEKLEVYECGEPAIGTSFVQFDLRFYVVALLFIIFEVEIAFFFPWATVFGKATDLMDNAVAQRQINRELDEQRKKLEKERTLILRELGEQRKTLEEERKLIQRELGVLNPSTSVTEKSIPTARSLAITSLIDIGVFFAVLLVGFAYVWKRGDLDWVRAVSKQRSSQVQRAPPGAPISQTKQEST